MKKQCAISIFVIASLINTIEASQQPRRERKPARQTRQVKKQTKPSMSDSDNASLYKQINFVNSYNGSNEFPDYKEYAPLKDFFLKNLCPIRNWTQQDKNNTEKWLRTAYNIALRDPNAASDGFGNPFFLIRSLATDMFVSSPYFLALPAINSKRQAPLRDFTAYVTKLAPDKLKRPIQRYIGNAQ